MKLSDFLRESGHGSLSKLSNTIGAPYPDVSRWASGKRPVPPHRCLDIEKATNGAVTRKDLRPNDWQKYWPELVQTA